MKKILLLFFAMLTCWSIAYAVPAKPGFTEFKQSDGSTISIQTVGDEFYSAFVTFDGLTVERNENGDWVYATTEEVTNIIAHDPVNRNAQEIAFVKERKEALKETAKMDESTRRLIRSVNNSRKMGEVPNIGTIRVPILLVQYTDIKMKHSLQDFQSHYTSGPNSAYQYFYDQSNGKFTPQFEVFGIYTLSNNREHYGGHGTYNNGSTTKDKGKGEMVAEAIQLAQNEGKIKWSNYDNNHDSECDVVVVVYAGVGEAQASTTHPESIWPSQWNLYSASYFGDGPGYQYYDNTYIDAFAVFNEIKGSNDNGTNLDGIGTFVHEFSHALGLPDFYETTYNYGYYGMGYWSLMCSGCYNGDGDVPVGYSAYEKNYFGWLTLIEPEPNTQYTLQAMNQGSEATDQAIKIVSDLNPNEFYILENRRRQRWDSDIANDGLLISHVTYSKARWQNNTVNNESVQLMTIAPADNTLSRSNESGDLWGNGKSDFTDTSTPAAKLYMTASGNITGNAGYLGKPVTEIKKNSDGTVSLWFMKGQENRVPELLPANEDAIDLTEFKAEWTYPGDESLVKSYTLEVNQQGEYKLLENADFSHLSRVVQNNSMVNVYTYASQYLPNGWSAENPLYVDEEHIMPGYSLTTKPYDLTGFSEVTVEITGRYFSSYYNPARFQVSLNDEDSEIYSFTSGSDVTYRFKLPCQGINGEQLTIYVDNFPCFGNIKIYAGDATDADKMIAKAPVETGNEITRTITGITDKSYIVKNLLSGGTFSYKVKAVFTDGRESSWSNKVFVTLVKKNGLLGDVNEDGLVDVTDVTVLINHILGSTSSPFNAKNADIDGNDTLDVTDATLLINMILAL